MSFALNEVEAMARKATRGAGYSWGMAEEAGKATRWLCAQGIDGCSSLARLLAITGHVEKTTMAPAASDGVWRAPLGQLCPLMAGAALSDFAYLLVRGEISMENVACPSLLLPFVATTARQQKTTLALDMDDVLIVSDGRVFALARLRFHNRPHACRFAGAGRLGRRHVPTAAPPLTLPSGTSLTVSPGAFMRPRPRNPACLGPVPDFLTMTDKRMQ